MGSWVGKIFYCISEVTIGRALSNLAGRTVECGPQN